eukprot:IDg10369t1
MATLRYTASRYVHGTYHDAVCSSGAESRTECEVYKATPLSEIDDVEEKYLLSKIGAITWLAGDAYIGSDQRDIKGLSDLQEAGLTGVARTLHGHTQQPGIGNNRRRLDAHVPERDLFLEIQKAHTSVSARAASLQHGSPK